MLQGFNGNPRLWTKSCPFCNVKQIRKNGKRNGRQRYQCTSCNRHFDGGNRINSEALWKRYSAGKQTAQQLAEYYGCCRKTIHRHLQKARLDSAFPVHAQANILMDTTCFGRSFGVLAPYDSSSQQALYVQAVHYETNALYLQAIRTLQAKGVETSSVVYSISRRILKHEHAQKHPPHPTPSPSHLAGLHTG